MATATKGPAKPGNDIKKESTPTKNEQPGKGKQEDPKKEPEKNDGRRDNRDNRHQNRRGGRHQPYGQRGGFRGGHGGGFRDGQRDGGGQYHSHGPQQGPHHDEGDFTGEKQEPKEPKKFTGRCRLFVGNITPDTTEEQFKNMFTPFGEVSEVFVNAARGFGFIRLDYRINAERAKVELDGQMRNNRVLRVRFATHGAALKVTNLSPFVSNELLEEAFCQFGEVERAVVTVDDRGRSCGEGIIEFARKPGATSALKRINEGVFLLSSFPRPIYVEPVDQRDEDDGLTEKFVQRNEGFRKDREKEPRFAPPGSFEYEFGMKHRRIDDMEREQIERVKQDMVMERNRLADEMETAIFDYQADQIRQDLMRQQEELKRLDEMKNEHMRRRQEMDMRRQEQMGQRNEGMMREEERRREMMMRASNTMNREAMGRDRDMGGRDMMNRDLMNREQMERENMNRDPMNRGEPGGQMGPGPGGRGGRPDEMMRPGGGPPGPMQQNQQRDGPGPDRPGPDRPGPDRPGPERGGGPQRGSGPGTPPMPPPPVPPGMNMDQQQQGRQGEMLDGRFQGMPGNQMRPESSPSNEGRGPVGGPGMDRPPQGMKQEQMQRPGPPNQPGGRFQGPPGNFQGNMGGPSGGMFQKMPGGGMGGNQNMGGGDRRREPNNRRDDFDAKRMRRY